MNDIVLTSLLNLFALVGAKNKVDTAKSLDLVEAYLKRFYGVRNSDSYLHLHSDLREFYDDCPDIDEAAIVDGICSGMRSRVSRDDQLSVLLRLMEFTKIGAGEIDPGDSIFLRVAKDFEVPDGLYGTYTDFVLGRENGSIRIIPFGNGFVHTLFDRAANTLVFSYRGDDVVLMNDVPVFNGIFQKWQQSGVLKCKNSTPFYYSTVMAHYGDIAPAGKVQMCGRDIEFKFDNSENGIHNLSFTLESGQLVAIMGGSGVGKSTLLSLLIGNMQPNKGSITINGHDISEPGAKALIGYVPQDDLLIEELTVYQNLWFTAKLCFAGMSDEELDRKVMSVLGQLGLDAARDFKVGSPLNKFISGGQRKRLNIALELIREPAILFLDEPTSGLSSTDTEMVVNLLKDQTEKGKLIVANIHQPSSDVYKLFDRLWLLDRGGYPIFDGNPIEAISFFKKAADYADADTSMCPACGNVNPETILNIVDAKCLDSQGNRTENRKVSPKAWHELYLSNRPEFDAVKKSEVPQTDQKKPGAFMQMLIFLRRNIKAKFTDMQYVLVTMLEAPLLAFICALLTRFTPENGVYTLMDNKNLPSYLFMAVIVSIFLGMSGSAEEIIKDRALLKREKFLHLSYKSYIFSKMIYMAGICLIQTLLFILAGNLVMGIHGMLWSWWLLLFISAFLSSLIGLLLSQCMGSVVSIYITIPVLLIPQILLCGLVVHFEDLNPGSKTGNVPFIGDVIPSRWSYEALAVATYSMNDYEAMTYDKECEKYTCQYYNHQYIHELKKHLETMQDEARQGEAPDPIHMRVIRNGLERLADLGLVEKYSGDWSVTSLSDYLEASEDKLSKRSNKLSLEIDAIHTAYTRTNGLQSLVDLKKRNFNIQLENLMVNLHSENYFRLVDNVIVPKIGQVYLPPMTRNGRAPFYSGYKMLGEKKIPTYWYDLGVLLFMCVLLSLCLLYNVPGQFVRKENL